METVNQEADISLEHATEKEIEIQENLNYYYNNQQAIDYRLFELDQELDVETYMQMQTSALSISGVILSLTNGKKWLLLPLLSSVIQLANLFKKEELYKLISTRLNIRTRDEIEKEKYALKAIRGDFKYLLDVPNVVWNAVNK